MAGVTDKLADSLSEGLDRTVEVAGRGFWSAWDASGKALRSVIGTRNDRLVKAIRPLVDAIAALEPGMKALSDDQLRAKTAEFKARLAPALSKLSPPAVDAPVEEKAAYRRGVQAALDAILPEAYATVREASRRVTRMRHFDVQMIGGIVLHQGKIAEMVTGEGKTLVGTCPSYLNALLGRGVHVVTVNDYLAKRDRDWMGPIYEFLDLSCRALQNDMDPHERAEAYRADVTYGTNSEFGFDYLRDNMAVRRTHQVQRDKYFAVVDEVDSILIDEARTPHIIAGPSEQTSQHYYDADRAMRQLQEGKDFEVKEKEHTVLMTEEGMERLEKILNVGSLYALENLDWPHFVEKALKAHHLFRKDREYVVQDGEIVIVDEHTGRLQPGRRWSDGQHQAIEAKEGMKIKEENQTLATVTLQHYFLMYDKLAGMTGTALTEADEFHKIYRLEVVAIPTNRALSRVSHPDVIYRSEREKYSAIEEEIDEIHRTGRPVLVGTISIEKSEMLGARLRRRGIRHEVLNAKNHQREAAIVAQAGQVGAVTIATNMAGRGTDILLGKPTAEPTELAYRAAWCREMFNAAPDAEVLAGKPEEASKAFLESADAMIVRKTEALETSRSRGAAPEKLLPLEEDLGRLKAARDVLDRYQREGVAGLGGLHILGTERHDARRIDNQLRGRSGRQGDPGSSRYYLSLEDDLLKKMMGDRLRLLMDRVGGMQEGDRIESRMVSRAMETAQKRIEEHHFEQRKNLLEYDNVMNDQRNLVYAQRDLVLRGDSLGDIVRGFLEDRADALLDEFLPADQIGAWDFGALSSAAAERYTLSVDAAALKGQARDRVSASVKETFLKTYAERIAPLGAESTRLREQFILLRLIDTKWKDHLSNMDHLRSGIGLRGYAQIDPRLAYKKEGFEFFDAMIVAMKEEAVSALLRVEAPEAAAEAPKAEDLAKLLESTWKISAYSGPTDPSETVRAPEPESSPQPLPELPNLPPMPPIPGRPGPGRMTPAAAEAGRNDPCPCGSGKKFKKCHGA